MLQKKYTPCLNNKEITYGYNGENGVGYDYSYGKKYLKNIAPLYP